MQTQKKFRPGTSRMHTKHSATELHLLSKERIYPEYHTLDVLFFVSQGIIIPVLD